ncbi:MAG: helix-turn-helix domain-containing protein, partial [bacterium]|nr:helix-turn-helix domain-containing protein [bacterium]
PILPTAAGSEMLPNNLLDRFHLDLNAMLAAVEKQLIQKAMLETAGNKSQAAKLLGIQTSLLYYKLDKHKIISN